MEETIIPYKIKIDLLMNLRDSKVKPIDGINIPNISMPPHLMSKKRATEADNSLSIDIRQLFNSLTSDNLEKLKLQLKGLICAKAQNIDMLNEISEEILKNFLISDKNIKNYMQLLNVVWNATVLQPNIDKNITPPTIGKFFLDKCRVKIFSLISEKNIRKLSEMDLDNLDQLDLYNRERESIINLLIIICELYGQRNTQFIKLNATHIYSVMKHILELHNKNQLMMQQLGNPYNDEECQNENEYEILRKMCTLYAEHLYTLIYREGKNFMVDKTKIKDLSGEEKQLSELMLRIQSEIVPKLTESYLISKYQQITY